MLLARYTLAAELLRHLTLRRALNWLAMVAGYAAARVTRRPIMWGMPVSVGIEPTTACNLRCPHCVSGLRAFTRPTGRLQPGVFDAVLEEVAPTACMLLMYFQGEPLLNPHFTDLVARARSKGLFVQTSTNGHFLSEETCQALVNSGLNHLIISVDGLTQETYSRYRIEGDLATVEAGIKRLVQVRKRLRRRTPVIDVQFIVFRHNEHEVPQLKGWFRGLGADLLTVKTAQVHDPTDATAAEWVPMDKNHARYAVKAAGVTLEHLKPRYRHCFKLWQGAEVTWDGRVLPCCYDKNAEYEMGQVPPQSFKKIWHSSSYAAFRRQLLHARESIPMCTNCTEGTNLLT